MFWFAVFGSSIILSLYALITASYVPFSKVCLALFASIATAANAGVAVAANGSDNAAAPKSVFICFLFSI